MKKIIIGIVAVIVIILIWLGVVYIGLGNDASSGIEKFGSDPKNATYLIDGEEFTLVDGISEKEAAPSSSSKIITKYFGNEVRADINDDKREDIIFLLTQETGGSGTFFYVVAALNTEEGWRGSRAMFLGDRIAPQTTEISQNPSHKNVIVINYADRKPGEPMSTQPSVGKSVWLKLDPKTMQFGVVEQNFEGEADPSLMSLAMDNWTWISTQYNDDRRVEPKELGDFVLTINEDGTFFAKTDCNNISGSYTTEKNSLSFGPIAMTKMFCVDSKETEFLKVLEGTAGYQFTSRGELILNLKFDSGTAIFR